MLVRVVDLPVDPIAVTGLGRDQHNEHASPIDLRSEDLALDIVFVLSAVRLERVYRTVARDAAVLLKKLLKCRKAVVVLVDVTNEDILYFVAHAQRFASYQVKARSLSFMYDACSIDPAARKGCSLQDIPSWIFAEHERRLGDLPHETENDSRPMPLDPRDTRPLCAIYLAWHPSFSTGERLAKRLYQHFRRDLFTNVAGGVGLSVLYRSASAAASCSPEPIPLDDSHIAVVFLLLNGAMAADPAWREYVRDLLADAKARGFTAQVVPICIDGFGLNLIGEINAVRFDTWSEPPELREVLLISRLTYDLSRQLRTYIASRKHPDVAIDQLTVFLDKVSVFLSHSKRDPYGQKIALAIMDFLAKDSALSQFFDARDIPGGVPFADVLEHYIQKSAVVAIYTDSFSSREWCRREIIEAKRANRPLVIADCIDEIDERSFPYLGNVPVVRMEPRAMERIPYVVARLLDEVFKDYLWSARLSHDGRKSDASIRYLPRPPELIALSAMKLAGEKAPHTIVYPDPALGAEEAQLFHDVRADLTLMPYTEYAAAYGGAP